MIGRNTLPASRPLLSWRHVGIGAVIALALAVFAFATLRPVKVLPRMQLAAGFALTD